MNHKMNILKHRKKFIAKNIIQNRKCWFTNG